MRNALVLAAAAALGLPALASAAVVHTILPAPLTTDANFGGGSNDGTGVWFNPLTGYAEKRGFFFPNPLFEDGKFFLLQDAQFAPTTARIFVQGFFSRGNGVVYASNTNLNPIRFSAGDILGPGVGFQSPGAGFSDLGPTFGNFPTGGQGYLGLTLRDPTGASSSDIFYGYADITVDPSTFAVTLNAFAFENVRNTAITIRPIPEPAALALLAPATLLLTRRRKA